MEYITCEHDGCQEPARWRSRAGHEFCNRHKKGGSVPFEPVALRGDEPEVSKEREYVFLKYDIEIEDWEEVERRRFDLESLAHRHADALTDKHVSNIDVRVMVEAGEAVD